MFDVTTDNAAEPMGVAKAILEAWDIRDFDAVLDLFAEEGVLHSMMIEPIVGKASIAARLSRLGAASHKTRLCVRHIGVIDGQVYVERVDEITLNGKQTDVPVVGVFRIENGLVASWCEYYDRRQLLGAMGIVEDFDRSAR
jgi:limonene-1,2-epoxide hydrolase